MMGEKKPRPVIFLYTEATQISHDVHTAIVEAGYLPVLVADVNEVRILAAPLAIEATDLSAITAAALDAIAASGMITSSHFGTTLAREVLAASQKGNKK